MMNRRSFLAALCTLPIVGKFIPKPKYRDLGIHPIIIDGRTVGYQRVYEGEPWAASTRAERIAAGRPVLDDDATIRNLAEYMQRVRVEAFNEAFKPRS